MAKRGRPPKKPTWVPPKEYSPQDEMAFTLRLPRVTGDALNIHARILRRVSRSVLVQDILACWLAAATDWDHPIFRASLTENAKLPDTPERYPGYLTSLGFAPALRVESGVDPSIIPSAIIREGENS